MLSSHRVIATVIEQFFPSEVFKDRARQTMTRKHRKEQRTEVDIAEIAKRVNTKNHALSL